MKSSLNKFLFWSAAFVLFQNGYTFSQPIQLIPRNEETLEEHQTNSLPSVPQAVTEFWEGTPPSVIETYFPKLPLIVTSPVLRKLQAQVIKKKYPEPLHNFAYEKMLLSLLIAEGMNEEAKEFLMETNFSEKDHLLLSLEWLEGHSKKVCEKVTNLMRTSADLEWKKQNIYCLFLNGEKERAKITLEILSESNPAAIQLLKSLFEPSSKPPLEESVASSPFLLTVWLEGGQNIPENELKSLSPSSLALVARSEKTPFQTRLLAAEKALQQGAFKGENFLALLNQASQAGLWGEFLDAFNSSQMEKLLPLFERAEQEQKLGLIAQIFGSSLSSLTPSLETLPLAPFMVRTLLQSDKKDLAKKWGAFFMREAPDEAIAVFPLLHLAFPENKWGAAQMQAWQAYESRVQPGIGVQHSYALRRVLEALDEPTGHPMKGEPSPPSWRQEKALFNDKTASLLESAALSKRKGEVLLLVLTLLGEEPLYECSVDKLVPVLRALNTVGFKEEARLLALEFLFAKGF